MESLPHTELDNILQCVRNDFADALNGNPPGSTKVDSLMQAMHTELSLILREHGGMTEELLRTYEQLGIVFEVTRKLPTVNTEKEVIRLFIDSLRVTYSDFSIWSVFRINDELEWTNDNGGRCDGPSSVASSVVGESIETGRVTVRSCSADGLSTEEILSAPVFSGTDFVYAIVLTHNNGVRSFDTSDMSLFEALALFCGDLIRNHRLMEELRTLSVDLVRALVSAIDQKDEYTSGHSNRVGHYAKLLGRDLGLGDEEIQMLEWSALLHDVGKIGIRDDVLKKQGKLTPDEFRHIQEHPVRSYEVVRKIPQLRDALDGVRHHHEHWDGKGYPDRLAGEGIPLQARIVQVADIFDALTTSRSYRAAFDWQTALGILQREAGTTVDPHLVEVFSNMIGRLIATGELVLEQQPPAEQAVASTDPPKEA